MFFPPTQLFQAIHGPFFHLQSLLCVSSMTLNIFLSLQLTRPLFGVGFTQATQAHPLALIIGKLLFAMDSDNDES